MGIDTLRSYKQGLGAAFALLLLLTMAQHHPIIPIKRLGWEKEKEEFLRVARPPPSGECDVLLLTSKVNVRKQAAQTLTAPREGEGYILPSASLSKGKGN